MNLSDRRSTASVVLAAAVMAAVSALPASAGTPWLGGSEWGYLPGSDDVSRRWVRFAVDGLVHGNGGCNKFRGSYELSGNAITISPVTTTRKACPEKVMAAERSFLAALTNARSAKASGITNSCCWTRTARRSCAWHGGTGTDLPFPLRPDSAMRGAASIDRADRLCHAPIPGTSDQSWERNWRGGVRDPET